MDLETLEKLARSLQEKLSGFRERSVDVRIYRATQAKLRNLLVISSKAFSEYDAFFKSVASDLETLDTHDSLETVEHILEILEIEKSSEAKIKGMKIFEGAEDKMKQAGLSFRKDDYPPTFHNLNTALELVLKDRLGIPTTITKINTSKIIDILVKHKVEPYLYLKEVKKRVLVIDNKIKHQGYSPSKIDCINGIKVMEELISRLRDKKIKLTEEIRNEIYRGL
jgi:HEPN domain-containing protein